MADEYLSLLVSGDRSNARELVERALDHGAAARDLMNELVWPAMERIQLLYREDKISRAQLNLATRLNRSLCDQLAARLVRSPSNGKTALIFCGDDEPEELGGQICAELFEADGYTVRFGGGGVPNDEVLSLIGTLRPDLLVMFATLPSGVPQVRKLIDYIREVNAAPNMQILCAGGIYKRAEGLGEEIGADLVAVDAASAVLVASQFPSRRASIEQQTVGRSHRVRQAAARRSASAA